MSSASHNSNDPYCYCPHHKLVPLFITLIGVTVLAQHLEFISEKSAGILWPSLLVLIGLQRMTQGWCSCCNWHKIKLPDQRGK